MPWSLTNRFYDIHSLKVFSSSFTWRNFLSNRSVCVWYSELDDASAFLSRIKMPVISELPPVKEEYSYSVQKVFYHSSVFNIAIRGEEQFTSQYYHQWTFTASKGWPRYSYPPINVNEWMNDWKVLGPFWTCLESPDGSLMDRSGRWDGISGRALRPSLNFDPRPSRYRCTSVHTHYRPPTEIESTYIRNVIRFREV